MRNTALFVSILLGLAVMMSACADQVADPDVGPHPENFASPARHGQVVLESPRDAESCAACHGDDFQGGTSGVSCYQCHEAYPHPEGFAQPGDAQFHTAFIQEEVAWHIETCTGCHGEDYAGADVEEKSCVRCHDSSPTSCRTCHGDGESAAPPEDLEGHTEPTFQGVGLHRAHLGETDVADLGTRSCTNCHPSVEGFLDDSHLDEIGAVDAAEIEFGALATETGAAATWHAADGTCSGVYCHGAFTFLQENSAFPQAYAGPTITGNLELLASWTEPEAGDLRCGSCHGLPPEGHITTNPRVNVTQCGNCHVQVVGDNLQIIDRSLHVNGQVEVFNTTAGKTAAGKTAVWPW